MLENGIEVGSQTPADLQTTRASQLTRREHQVVEMLARGWTNKRIAAELFVCEDTVKFHLKAAYRKIGVRRRIEAVFVASNLGLIRFPGPTPA